MGSVADYKSTSHHRMGSRHRTCSQREAGGCTTRGRQIEDCVRAIALGRGDDYWATQVHVQINEALAWVAHAEGKNDESVKLIRDAADEEDAIEKGPVTPGAIVPAREQLDDLLLELGRPRGSPQGV